LQTVFSEGRVLLSEALTVSQP